MGGGELRRGFPTACLTYLDSQGRERNHGDREVFGQVLEEARRAKVFAVLPLSVCSGKVLYVRHFCFLILERGGVFFSLGRRL